MTASVSDLPLHGQAGCTRNAAKQRLIHFWGALCENLEPIAHIGGGFLACVHATASGAQSPVILFHPLRPLHEQALLKLADSEEDYWRKSGNPSFILEALEQSNTYQAEAAAWQTAALAVFRTAVEEFHANETPHSHLSKTPLPRKDTWKPIRHCVHDSVLGFVCYKYDRASNQLITRAFISSDHGALERGAGTVGLLKLLLSEAYASGGSMALRFVAPLGDNGRRLPPIPPDVWALARLLGLPVNRDAEELNIEAAHTVMLFVAGLSKTAQQQLFALNVIGEMPLDAACHLVLTGAWPPRDLESFIHWAPSPAGGLTAFADPLLRTLANLVLPHLRAAYLSGAAEQWLDTIASNAGGWIDSVVLRPGESAIPHSRRLLTGCDLNIPLPFGDFQWVSSIPLFLVPIAAPAHQLLSELTAIVAAVPKGTEWLLITTADFKELPLGIRNRISSDIERSNGRLLCLAEDLVAVDNLLLSRSVFQP